jgi:hypothetical protein
MSAPTTAAPSLFFADARSCKAWLAGLPMTNLAHAQSEILDALRVFNRAPFDPLERLKCLELARDKVAFLLGEQRSRHFFRALPLAQNDAASWTMARALLEEMEAGYRRAATEAALAEAHGALIAQRTIRYLAAQMTLLAGTYRPVEGALWNRLHRQYALAEAGGFATGRVKDSLEGEAGLSSVAEAYVQAVLFHAAAPAELAAPQADFIESLLRLWARKVRIVDAAIAPTLAGPSLWIDLASAEGALHASLSCSTARVLDLEGLARSIRRRIRALQGGEDAASLGLPVAAGAVDPLLSLTRLHERWFAPVARAPMEAAGESIAAVVFGFRDAHFVASGGKSFEQPGKERELSRQEKEDIAVFGRITQRTQSMVATQGSPVTPETWDLVEQSIDALRLVRRTGATHAVAVGRLVAVRRGDAGTFHLGVVRALQDDGERLAMLVAPFPGKPEPIAVRSGQAPWTQAFRLPALANVGVAATLVVPATMATRGRAVQVWSDGAREAKVHELVERAADFDRITLV